MKRRPQEWVWLNGHFRRAATAHLSVFDRGFLYGDALFETCRAYDGLPFRLDLHLRRLRQSAHGLGITWPRVDWSAVIADLIRRNRDRNVAVRITLSRGVGRGLAPLRGVDPTTLIFTTAVDPRLGLRQQKGIGAITLPYSRGGLAEHKHAGYLAGVLGKREAARGAADEAIFTDGGRYVLEATTSNLFVRLGKRWITPVPAGILPGVTRQLVMQLGASCHSPVLERRIRLAELISAEEAFLTSSIAEIVPLVAIDGVPIGTGRPGAQTLELGRAYRQMIDRALCSAVAP